MNKIYIEQLLKRKTLARENLLKILLVLATIYLFYWSVKLPVLLIFLIVILCVDISVFRKLDIEYEYLYFDGSLEIDKIWSKARRKNIFSVNFSEVEIVAMAGTPQLRQYQGLKKKDYSSRISGRTVYEMIFFQNGKRRRIIFEPNKDLVEIMHVNEPNKVIMHH